MDDEVTELARQLLDSGLTRLSERERRVILYIAKRSHVARNVNSVLDERLTFGERLADRVAQLGGSWTFIVLFTGMLVAWVVVNTVVLARSGGGFDPYPYIFLNLLLSMVAALQAPVILMSQNRQAVRDRLAASLDYEINLKAEVEIMALHEKLDRIRLEHVEEMLRDLTQRVEASNDPARAAVKDRAPGWSGARAAARWPEVAGAVFGTYSNRDVCARAQICARAARRTRAGRWTSSPLPRRRWVWRRLIAGQVAASPVVAFDETSVRVAGRTWWEWVFVTSVCVLHVIRPSRGAAVVRALFGAQLPRVWVSDSFGSQRGHGELWQMCLAHLLHDANTPSPAAARCRDRAAAWQVAQYHAGAVSHWPGPQVGQGAGPAPA